MPLVTAATVKGYIPELSGSGADAIITSIISRVETQFSQFLGFPRADSNVYTLDSTTYTLYLDGPMYSDSEVLVLPIKPVTAITSVHSDVDRVYGSSSLIAASEYELDIVSGRVILKPNQATQVFDNSFRAIKVICTAGFTSAPADLEHAICYQSALIFRGRSNIGNESINQRQASVRLKRLILEDEVKEILYPFRPSEALL